MPLPKLPSNTFTVLIRQKRLLRPVMLVFLTVLRIFIPYEGAMQWRPICFLRITDLRRMPE